MFAIYIYIYIMLITSLRLRVFSQLSFINYMGLCFSQMPYFPFLFYDSESIYTSSYRTIESEIWIISHCLASGHETMTICAVCLSMLSHSISMTHAFMICNPKYTLIGSYAWHLSMAASGTIMSENSLQFPALSNSNWGHVIIKKYTKHWHGEMQGIYN